MEFVCQALDKARIKRVSVIEALAEIGWLVKHEAGYSEDAASYRSRSSCEGGAPRRSVHSCRNSSAVASDSETAGKFDPAKAQLRNES